MQFCALIEELDHGQVDQHLSEMLTELATAVQATGDSGTLTVKVTVAAEGNKAVVTVAASHKVPRDPMHSTLFFFGRDGELVRDDPKQLALNLKDAPPQKLAAGQERKV